MQLKLSIFKNISFLFYLGLLTTSATAFSQTACPIGVAAGSPQCGPSALPTGTNQEVAPAPRAVPTGRWITKWGAVAIADSGDMGVAVGKASRREANNEAVRQCKTWGSPGCKPLHSYANQCAAIARTDGDEATATIKSMFSGGDTVEAASSRALSSCQEVSSGMACKIIYAECSKPVFQPYR